jgi:hypothetical protein
MQEEHIGPLHTVPEAVQGGPVLHRLPQGVAVRSRREHGAALMHLVGSNPIRSKPSGIAIKTLSSTQFEIRVPYAEKRLGTLDAKV